VRTRQALLLALIFAGCVDEVDLRLPPAAPIVDAGIEPMPDPDSGIELPSECVQRGLFCTQLECPPTYREIPDVGCEADPAGLRAVCCELDLPPLTCDQLQAICLDPNTSTTCPGQLQLLQAECPNAPSWLCCGS
jgi:hypothetical protein